MSEQTNSPTTTDESAEVESAHDFEVDGQRIRILLALKSPRIVLLEGLLSAEECDALIEGAVPTLDRSTVIDSTSGLSVIDPVRTSESADINLIDSPIMGRLNRRIEALTGIPVENGEKLQILRYAKGGEYKPHHDFFDPDIPGDAAQLAHGGQRIATVIVYLNNVIAGGETSFPQVGLEITPRKGLAVYFGYGTTTTDVDYRSLHAGRPVLAGQKWITTKWLRDRAQVYTSAVTSTATSERAVDVGLNVDAIAS